MPLKEAITTFPVITAGTKGRRGLYRLAFGSVAEEVVRRAGCPVLTINPKVRLR